MRADVVVIGAGHNGLVCATYLAQAGLDVVVLEAGPVAGGCLITEEAGEGRLELGGYEHVGLRSSGIAAELGLEDHGLSWVLRDEISLGLGDDGIAIPIHSSLERTHEEIAAVFGAAEADAYVEFAGWAKDAIAVLTAFDGGPPPSIRTLGLGALAAGGAATAIARTALAPASAVLAQWFEDQQLRAMLSYPAVWMQQPPSAVGSGAAALKVASGHGRQAARAAGGGGAIAAALSAALAAAGGRLRCDCAATRVELTGGRASAVQAGGERFVAATAVVSAIDARRLASELIVADQLPAALRRAARGMHVGLRNVGKLKVDAIVDTPARWPGPPAFERAAILSAGEEGEFDRAFRAIEAGRLPARPPFELARPSDLESGWAGDGRTTITLSSIVPDRRADGAEWDAALLDATADDLLESVGRVLGEPLAVRERRVTGPRQWAARIGSAASDANHLDMTPDQLLAWRPAATLAGYRTPIEGLWLTGAGTHPGGGVNGNAGRNTALALLGAAGALSPRHRLSRARRRVAALRRAGAAARRLERGAGRA